VESLTDWRCKICGAKVDPGCLTCGNKDCQKDFIYKNFIKNGLGTPVYKARKEYMSLHIIEIRRATWRW